MRLRWLIDKAHRVDCHGRGWRSRSRSVSRTVTVFQQAQGRAAMSRMPTVTVVLAGSLAHVDLGPRPSVVGSGAHHGLHHSGS